MPLTSDPVAADTLSKPGPLSMVSWCLDRFYTFIAGIFLAFIIDNIRYGHWRWEDPNARFNMVTAPIILVIVPLIIDRRRAVRRLVASKTS
jgi:hypothetical protein